MDDIVGRLASACFIIFSLTIIPLMIIFNNLDLSQRSALDTIVSTYTDEVRSTGVISKENYEDFLRKLSSTGYTYDIKIVHKSKTAVPTTSGSYKIAYKAYSKSEILSYIEGFGPDGEPGTSDDTSIKDYVMKSGDFISIKVVADTETTGSKLFRSIINGSSIIKLGASSGGMVGNTR